jgi:ribosomal peptide maturation radical SAM protein 1
MQQRPDIVFVSMPFADLDSPALGISILQSLLEREGYRAHILYLNLLFAELMGKEFYCDYLKYDAQNPESTNHIPFEALAGEWAFAQNYYGDDAPPARDFTDLLQQAPWKLSRRAVNAVLTLKNRVPHFLDECLSRFDWERYAVVGFTSTFQQTMPSLYLARALKNKYPQLKIIFGGANCEGEMGVELLRQYHFIDCVCLGEGEPVIPRVIENLFCEVSNNVVANVAFRKADGSITVGPHAKSNFVFEEPSIPNFDHYFDQLRTTRLPWEIRPWIHMEASRGCWWGMKQHCTFCGLNGTNMFYRSKKPDQVFNEMMHHSSKYQVTDFAFMDNILDMSYFDTLLPALSKMPQKFRVWVEVKSNLKRDQIKQLGEAGFTDVQPGIESFSTKILAQMKKGVTAIQNVAFLKWARQFNVRAWWNILYGFPNEDEQEYLTQVETLKRIVHLQRPSTICQIRLDRFSPNYNRSAELGFVNVRPSRPYNFIFPFPDDVLSRLCYYFDFDYEDGRKPQSYTKLLRQFWLEWVHHPDPGELTITPLPDYGAIIRDTRFTKKHSKFQLSPTQYFIYQSCDSPTTIKNALRQLGEKFSDKSFNATSVNSFFEYMESNYLMLKEGDRFLSLAVAQHD